MKSCMLVYLQSADSCVSVSEYWETGCDSDANNGRQLHEEEPIVMGMAHEERRLSERSLPLGVKVTRRHKRKTRRKHSLQVSK